MKGDYLDHRISTMFLVSFVLFLLTIPGQLYEYYERNLVWYAILIGASVFVHIWWCAEMYWAGKRRCFHMLWLPGYFAVCALIIILGMHREVDAVMFVLLPIFMVIFSWECIFDRGLGLSELGNILTFLVPIALFCISFLYGYCRGRARGEEQPKEETEQINREPNI